MYRWLCRVAVSNFTSFNAKIVVYRRLFISSASSGTCIVGVFFGLLEVCLARSWLLRFQFATPQIHRYVSRDRYALLERIMDACMLRVVDTNIKWERSGWTNEILFWRSRSYFSEMELYCFRSFSVAPLSFACNVYVVRPDDRGSCMNFETDTYHASRRYLHNFIWRFIWSLHSFGIFHAFCFDERKPARICDLFLPISSLFSGQQYFAHRYFFIFFVLKKC